jgi:hypothetical protein
VPTLLTATKKAEVEKVWYSFVDPLIAVGDEEGNEEDTKADGMPLWLRQMYPNPAEAENMRVELQSDMLSHANYEEPKNANRPQYKMLIRGPSNWKTVNKKSRSRDYAYYAMMLMLAKGSFQIYRERLLMAGGYHIRAALDDVLCDYIKPLYLISKKADSVTVTKWLWADDFETNLEKVESIEPERERRLAALATATQDNEARLVILKATSHIERLTVSALNPRVKGQSREVAGEVSKALDNLAKVSLRGNLYDEF